MKQIINELAMSVIDTIETKDLYHIQDLVTELENFTLKPDDDTQDYYRIASGFYQCDDLPDNYLELEDDEFHELLEANAWQPFQDHRGEVIALFIENLSVEMENIARRERKKVLDQLKANLNIEPTKPLLP
jgi:hypothetical protein